MGGIGEDNYCDQDDDMEENDILKRELGENTNSIGDSSQKKVENAYRGTNVTTDTSNITEQAKNGKKT